MPIWNSPRMLQVWKVCTSEAEGDIAILLTYVSGLDVGRFHGNLSLDLPENEEIEKSGYAGIRTKVYIKETALVRGA